MKLSDLANMVFDEIATQESEEERTARLIAEITSLRAALAEMTAERDRHRDMAAHLTRGKRG